MVSFVSHQTDPVSAAEGHLLAWLSAAVLFCVAALERPRLPEGAEGFGRVSASRVGVGALLVLALLWAVPSGAARGTGITLLLFFLLARTTVERMREASDRLPLVLTAPLCLGLQGLYMPELFLEGFPEPSGMISSWLPALTFSMTAALALNLLARRHGARNALLAGGVVLLASRGWSPLGASSLFALAAGGFLWRTVPTPSSAKVRGWGQWTPVILLILGIALAAGAGFPRRPLVFLVLLAMTSAASAAGLLELRRGSQGLLKLPILILLALGAMALLLEDSSLAAAREPAQALGLLALGLALLPQALLAPRLRSLAALLLAFLAARWLPGTEAAASAGVAGALAFLALGLPQETRGAWVQNLWLGFWVLLGTAAAGYPWLRGGLEDLPLVWSPEGFGLGVWSPWWIGVALVAGGWILEGALSALGKPVPRPVLAAAAGFALVSATAARIPPAGETVLASEAITLTQDRPRWQVKIPETPARKLTVVSNLAFAADLPAGRPVAVLRLHHPDGSTTLSHLRAGTDTAEWAARRPDVASRPELVTPQPWRVSAAPDGPFFSQRYRSVHPLDTEEPVVSVDIFRRRNLPEEVSLTLFQLELLP